MIWSTSGIGDGVALAGFVAIPARAGLLAEAAELADAIGDAHVAHLRMLGVVTLADVPADVVAREIRHAERAHREAEGFDGARRPAWARRPLPASASACCEYGLIMRLPMKPSQTPATTAVLPMRLGQRHRGGQHVGTGLLRAHHFEQPHDVRGTEEMQTEHVAGALRERGDGVDVQRRGVGGEDRAAPGMSCPARGTRPS